MTERNLLLTLWDNPEWLTEIEDYKGTVKSDNDTKVYIEFGTTVDVETLDVLVKFTEQLLREHLPDYWKKKRGEECPVII